jgi:hypothetical protein
MKRLCFSPEGRMLIGVNIAMIVLVCIRLLTGLPA